ncbi:rheacalcin-1-like [Tiliqua scincoides]|uniref:rheacalcin-1-like n=1 Tax=Tiliqua scincoides TaxID=71010 RepID=UPI003461E3DF
MFMYNDHCYDYTEQKMDWEQAEGYCRKMGGHLLSLNFEQEHKFIATQLTRKSFSEDVWMGLSVTKETCNWDWSDNSLLTYSAWGDVTDDLRNKHCAVLGGSSSFMKWNHRSCSDKHGFICKVTPLALIKAFQDMEKTTPLPANYKSPP